LSITVGMASPPETRLEDTQEDQHALSKWCRQGRITKATP